MRRGLHPHSRANLRRPWLPGESGNVAGRPAHPVPEPGHELEFSAAGLGITDKHFVAVAGSRSSAPEPKPPPIRCSVCRHQDLPVIDGLLVLRVPLRAIARNHGLARSALDRHRRFHLPAIPDASKARATMRADEIVPFSIEKLKFANSTGFIATARPVFDRLWEGLLDCLSDSPEDRLFLALASACIWLCRPQGGDDIRKAIHLLEGWRDIPTSKQQGVNRAKHRNREPMAGHPEP